MTLSAYLKVTDLIRQRIYNGVYKPGQIIASEKRLCEETSFGRSTIRKGLSLLVNEGLIKAIQGKGYCVCEPKNEEFSLLFNETNALETGGDDVIIINVKITVPDESLRAKLNLLPAQNTVLIERIIKSLGKYAAYDCKYIPYSAKSPVVERELYSASTPQMFSRNKSLFGIDSSMNIRIGTINAEEAKILRCEPGEPALLFDQLITDSSGEVMGCSLTKFIGKYLKLKAISE